MSSLTLAIALLTAGGGAACDCTSGWLDVIQRTEAMIVHKKPLRMPRDPLGTRYEPACVRIVFTLDARGSPKNVKIDRSSRNRVLDVAARETLKNYKFSPPDDRDADPILALVFEIPGSKVSGTINPRP
ncbi:TonB family protein [Xanthomonas euvesicatoria]|uniref:TonB family protein n=1 Tax=Xanthomonas euvesicatoria TaxID=456327 RepID=UPI003A0FD559